jgi:hypothetical protein
MINTLISILLIISLSANIYFMYHNYCNDKNNKDIVKILNDILKRNIELIKILGESNDKETVKKDTEGRSET